VLWNCQRSEDANDMACQPASSERVSGWRTMILSALESTEGSGFFERTRFARGIGGVFWAPAVGLPFLLLSEEDALS
jgi:hypothetical protein